MSLFDDYEQQQLTDFRGAWPLLEPGDVPLTNALFAQNMEYLPGQTRSRLGFGVAQNPGDTVLSMRTWQAPSFSGIANYLLYLAQPPTTNVGINLMTLASGAVSNLYAPAGSPVAAIFDFGGIRAFIATINNQGLGSDSGYVWTPTNVAINGGLDKLFAPPIGIVPTITNNGAGIVTAGTHQIGYIITTRGGLLVAPSPNSVGTFTPAIFTAPGATQLLFNMTTTWPSYAQGISVIMTTAGGAQYRFVPGATAGVLGGTSSTVNIPINIDDGTLAATGQDATPYFTQIANFGIPPFKPSFLINYSQRMAYVGQDALGTNTLFVSDQNAFQAISLARNVVYLPGQLAITACFVLYNTLYIVGPHWTYAVQDNGSDPVTWASPQLIDGQVGTLSVQGTTVNAAQGIAWVCATDGLYMFQGGAYASLPISYYQSSDWQRINWADPHIIQVVDNREIRKVMVLAPLDGATKPSHILTWDYTRGLTPETVNYSLDSLNGYSLGAIAKVQNNTTGHIETWLGPSVDTLPMLRQNNGSEINPYRDNGQAITALYKTALLPALLSAPAHHHGDMLRVSGYGGIYITVETLDGRESIPLSELMDEQLPAQLFLKRYHLLSEAVTLTISNQAQPALAQDIDNQFVLSQLTHYFAPFVRHR